MNMNKGQAHKEWAFQQVCEHSNLPLSWDSGVTALHKNNYRSH